MPTAAAEAREDEVVGIVVSNLVAGGRSAELVDRPDRNPDRADGLTVDAELRVDAERWAMDVITLRYDSQLESAVGKLEARLKREFGAQLDAGGTRLSVLGYVLTDETGNEGLVELARRALRSGEQEWSGDELAFVQLRPLGEDSVGVGPWLGRTADLRVELTSSSGGPIAKKLRRQLGRARDLGYQTCLALDQKGAGDLQYPANFLPDPATILQAITDVEQQVGVNVDLLVLVASDDAAHWLRP